MKANQNMFSKREGDLYVSAQVSKMIFVTFTGKILNQELCQEVSTNSTHRGNRYCGCVCVHAHVAMLHCVSKQLKTILQKTTAVTQTVLTCLAQSVSPHYNTPSAERQLNPTTYCGLSTAQLTIR